MNRSDFDFTQARCNMLQSQLETWKVLDADILESVMEVAREKFVPPAYRYVAYADWNIPLAHGETMLRPLVEGRMLQTLAPGPDETILEVGTGSGYFTACLAKRAKRVISVDIYPDLVEGARQALAACQIDNVTLSTGDASQGWTLDAPYHGIVLTGALSQKSLLNPFLNQLASGGRLLAAVGYAPTMELILFTKDHYGNLIEHILLEVEIPLLQHQNPSPAWVL